MKMYCILNKLLNLLIDITKNVWRHFSLKRYLHGINKYKKMCQRTTPMTWSTKLTPENCLEHPDTDLEQFAERQFSKVFQIGPTGNLRRDLLTNRGRQSTNLNQSDKVRKLNSGLSCILPYTIQGIRIQKNVSHTTKSNLQRNNFLWIFLSKP